MYLLFCGCDSLKKKITVCGTCEYSNSAERFANPNLAFVTGTDTVHLDLIVCSFNMFNLVFSSVTGVVKG